MMLHGCFKNMPKLIPLSSWKNNIWRVWKLKYLNFQIRSSRGSIPILFLSWPLTTNYSAFWSIRFFFVNTSILNGRNWSSYTTEFDEGRLNWCWKNKYNTSIYQVYKSNITHLISSRCCFLLFYIIGGREIKNDLYLHISGKSSNLTLCIYIYMSRLVNLPPPPSKGLYPPALMGGGWLTRRSGCVWVPRFEPRHSACYYFGVRSEDERWAEEERSRWVLDVSRAIRLATGITTENGSWFGFGFNAMIGLVKVGFFRKLLILLPKDSQKGLKMECRLIIEYHWMLGVLA